MLDLGTLHFSSAVSRGAYLAVFLVLAVRQREARYLWHWIGAILASLLGALVLFNNPIDEQLPVWVSMQLFAFYMASLVLSWSGLRRFYGHNLHWPALLILIVLPSLVCLPRPWLNLSAHTTTLVFFMCAALAAGLVVVEIIRARSERLWSQLVVALAFTGYCASFLLVVLLLQFTSLQVSSKTSYLSMIFDQVTSILVYVGYIAMNGERANLKLRQQADTDPLTGLFNRRGIQRMLKERPCEGAESEPMSVVIGDLDHFKRINDTLGHEGGDVVLRIFTERLKSTLRRDDLAVRWGGEEFLVVLPHTDIEAAEVFAERLRELTETHPFQVCGKSLAITISIGIAEVERPAEHFNKAIQQADKALYRAKREGRNRVCR
ncbi:GGDEF domain-containing protein [Kushneria indalinina]|uniref:diguanylate cyclase n=1 Tax=Kushneria indalinina DSM 14324 TaxID=1122140 RepID=A0A3D9DZV0_9GAMM|nr:GGDEF domain-containing protein [Kushneria indalinina]REC96318.1 diguanylate cyclase (GGDEF)-like protein [Kushneria indalinina DSM 14324]